MPNIPIAAARAPDAPHDLARPVRRVMCLGAAAGSVDAIGFLGLGGIYVAAMTGNTVQIGIAAAAGAWRHSGIVAGTIGSFLLGGILAAWLRRRVPQPVAHLALLAALVLAAQVMRSGFDGPSFLELVVLAVAMGMQGMMVSRFGGTAVHTIIMTGNLIKFADALVDRYGWRDEAAAGDRPRASVLEVVLPGCAWVAYALGAAGGAVAVLHTPWPLGLPLLLLLGGIMDLMLSARQRR